MNIDNQLIVIKTPKNNKFLAVIDLDKEFITVIPDSKINDLEYIQTQTIRNRDFSIRNRHAIIDYARQFDWSNIIEKYYLPSIQKVRSNYDS